MPEQNNLKKDNKANMPVTILVILTIALCIFTLIAFKLSSNKTAGNINEFNILDNVYAISDAINAGSVDNVPLSLLEDYSDQRIISADEIKVTKKKIPNAIKRFFGYKESILYQVRYAKIK